MGRHQIGNLIPSSHGRWPFLLLFALVASALGNAHATPSLTPSPLEEVMLQSRETGKPVLVAFLGPDWSVACRKFQQRVLSSDAFTSFAREHLLYWPVQARRQPRLQKKERARLQALVIHFDIRAYPTILLLDPDGTERLRHGYREISGKAYVRLLEALLPPAP
ncbi:MAG: hypothetical protein GVY10_05840 [Verrucomicrobia bacterium]|jgi:thiol-disulfide isomerase/thioredoxin|nr:hypothetical protein [Verrucomicrobiota bacterium]